MIHPKSFPYDWNAFEPYLSAQNIYNHYQYNYLSYIKYINKYLENDEPDIVPIIIDEVDSNYYGDNFLNNAFQVYNHEMFWSSLRPPSLGRDNISQSLYDDIINESSKIFGSGWTFICENNKTKNLIIKSEQGARNPVFYYDLNLYACIDLWEHAFYLDYVNQRKNYLHNLIMYCLDI